MNTEMPKRDLLIAGYNVWYYIMVWDPQSRFEVTFHKKTVSFSHPVVATEILDNSKEAVEIEVLACDDRCLVDRCAPVVHELVELRHKVVLLFIRFIVRRLKHSVSHIQFLSFL